MNIRSFIAFNEVLCIAVFGGIAFILWRIPLSSWPTHMFVPVSTVATTDY
jgi:hypothetical protein